MKITTIWRIGGENLARIWKYLLMIMSSFYILVIIFWIYFPFNNYTYFGYKHIWTYKKKTQNNFPQLNKILELLKSALSFHFTTFNFVHKHIDDCWETKTNAWEMFYLQTHLWGSLSHHYILKVSRFFFFTFI